MTRRACLGGRFVKSPGDLELIKGSRQHHNNGIKKGLEHSDATCMSAAADRGYVMPLVIGYTSRRRRGPGGASRVEPMCSPARL